MRVCCHRRTPAGSRTITGRGDGGTLEPWATPEEPLLERRRPASARLDDDGVLVLSIHDPEAVPEEAVEAIDRQRDRS
jgi:hypothetical protein